MGAAGLGANIFGNMTAKKGTEQVSTKTPQQQMIANILGQIYLDKLGQWTMTPRGLVFEYNPEQPPEYPLPRTAGLTGLQQQGIQQASNLGNMQQSIMGQGAPNYMDALSKYKPGNIQELAGQYQKPATLQNEPYQFNQMALTGMGPGRPDVKQDTKYFSLSPMTPQSHVDPFSQVARPMDWAGPINRDMLANNLSSQPYWNPKWGPVPPVGYMEPKDREKASGIGKLLSWPAQGTSVGKALTWPFSDLAVNTNKNAWGWRSGNSPYEPRAMGGPVMAGMQQQRNPQYLVGEKGPEMHVANNGQRNMVGENGPEIFDPSKSGQIIPNNKLQGQQKQGVGPQQRTGQEKPLPQNMQGAMGGMGQMGNMGPRPPMPLVPQQMVPQLPGQALAPRAEGGPVSAGGTTDITTADQGSNSRWWYSPSGQEYEIPQFNNAVEWAKWLHWPSETQPGVGQGPGWETHQALTGAGFNPATYWNTPNQFEPQQRTDWGSQEWDFDNNAWSVSGSADQWTPGAQWNPTQQGYTGGNWTYNYATGQWEMPQAFNQYSAAPLEGWSWMEPGEGQTGQAMWAPEGYQFAAAPAQETPYDWSQQQWTYDPTTGQWSVPMVEGQSAPFAGATPYYPNQAWQMGAFTNPNQPAPISGWQWATPGEGQTGQGMWAPQGFTGFGAAEPPSEQPPAEEPPTETEEQQAELPTYEFAVDPNQFPSYTGAEWWQENYPEEYASLMQLINNPQSAYTYNPEDITQTWQQAIYEPGMQTWQEDVAPWLKEQFVKTGNVMGSEMPRYLTREAGKLQQNYEGILAQMQQEGRMREASALQDMYNRQMQAMNTWAGVTSLPSQAGYTDAMVDQIYNQIDTSQISLPAEMKQALMNVDLTRAGIAQIYDQLSITNPNVNDSQKIDNIIKLAQLDSMQGSALQQQVQTIGNALQNIGMMMSIAQPEQMTVQNVLTMTYEDWLNAVGPENVVAATTALSNLLGYGMTENIVYNPAQMPMDLSWLGSLFAGSGD